MKKCVTRLSDENAVHNSVCQESQKQTMKTGHRTLVPAVHDKEKTTTTTTTTAAATTRFGESCFLEMQATAIKDCDAILEHPQISTHELALCPKMEDEGRVHVASDPTPPASDAARHRCTWSYLVGETWIAFSLYKVLVGLDLLRHIIVHYSMYYWTLDLPNTVSNISLAPRVLFLNMCFAYLIFRQVCYLHG